MSSIAQRLITAEEFWLLPGSKHQELIGGEVVETIPPGGIHAEIAGELVRLLRNWFKQGRGGYAGVEAGFILARDPDKVRGPDVYFVRPERIPASGVPEAFWPIAPDLAVEVVSPSETADEVREKVRDFLTAGTPMVWTVYPRSREVVVHTADGLARTYADEDVIEFPEVLPGFSCKVAELFE
ncbi:MAG: Uma2 family endonuclease [Chloroflexia bacterium]